MNRRQRAAYGPAPSRAAFPSAMRVFLDFEASSLSKHSYPVEVGWVFEDGREESHLIRPAPEWTDWDTRAEAIHGIGRATLEAEGEPAAEVAARMVAVLTGHDLLASAPSWDGKWLSVLLRAGGQPRHALRLRDTDDDLAETATALLADRLTEPELAVRVGALRTLAAQGRPAPDHRALADARDARALWLRLRALALVERERSSALDRAKTE